MGKGQSRLWGGLWGELWGAGVGSGAQGGDGAYRGDIGVTGVGSGALGPAEAWEQGKPAALPAMTAGEWQLGEPLPPGEIGRAHV